MSRSLPESSHALLRAWPASALALWTAAWRAGAVAPDDVLHTLHDYAQSHDVDAAPGAALSPGATALDLIRVVGDAAVSAVALPAAGDAQGLPPGVFDDEVLGAGEVLLLADADRAVTAVTARGTIERCRWTVRPIEAMLDVEALGPEQGIGEIEYALRDAVGEAAAVIAGLSGPRSSGPADLRDALAARTRAGLLDLPPHDRPRVDRMLATAAQIDAIVELAGGGLGASARQLEAADSELRRLTGLTRRARAAAINTLLRDYRRSA
ncbi:MAG: serine/threonine protein kinase [Gordonia sp. (in: high G+C Gram-positive bacteria)]|uniref:serine/threonine protein kinase n=1 Tax=Gordonia sp. (in: high G+C Gram-positive bacteria) TaxID=84139 RepID=UPI0039E53FA9